MTNARRVMGRDRSGSGVRAFTLIELLIVIGIIALLIVIGLAVGRQVTGRGKEAFTLDTIRTLDQVLADYMAAKDGLPPAWVPNPTDTDELLPVADARAGTEMINSVGLFILQAEEVPTAKASLQGLDSRQIREFQPLDGTTPSNDQPLLRTVFDGWGNPIRYVHPKFHGIIDPALSLTDPSLLGPPPTGTSYAFSQIRRLNGDAAADENDADGGLCVGGRPYFYSAGPDGDPSTTDDNVYTTKPQFSK